MKAWLLVLAFLLLGGWLCVLDGRVRGLHQATQWQFDAVHQRLDRAHVGP